MQSERRRILLKLFNGPRFNGDRAKFMKETKLSKGRLTQLFNEKEKFGELAASRIAESLGLPPDYFDRPDQALAALQADQPEPPKQPGAVFVLPSSADLPFAADVMTALHGLDSEGLRLAENALRAHLDIPTVPKPAPQPKTKKVATGNRKRA